MNEYDQPINYIYTLKYFSPDLSSHSNGNPINFNELKVKNPLINVIDYIRLKNDQTRIPVYEVFFTCRNRAANDCYSSLYTINHQCRQVLRIIHRKATGSNPSDRSSASQNLSEFAGIELIAGCLKEIIEIYRVTEKNHLRPTGLTKLEYRSARAMYAKLNHAVEIGYSCVKDSFSKNEIAKRARRIPNTKKAYVVNFKTSEIPRFTLPLSEDDIKAIKCADGFSIKLMHKYSVRFKASAHDTLSSVSGKDVINDANQIIRHHNS